MQIRLTHWVHLGCLLALLCASPAASARKVYTEDEESQNKRSWLLRPTRNSPVDQLDYADSLARKKQLKKADKQYRALVDSWPNSPEAAVAQHKHAEILHQRGKYQKSFDALQKLIEKYPGRFQFDDVLQAQFDIAVEVMNRRAAKFLFLPGFESPERALDMLDQIVRNGPRWEHAAEAQYLQGSIREHIQEYELAVLDYTETYLRYPASEFAEKAIFGRARTLVRLSDASPHDTDATQDAWYAFTLFNTTYPESEFSEQALAYTEKIYDRLALDVYEIATFYDFKAKKPKAALFAYEDFVKRFPSSKWTPTANQRIQKLKQLVKDDGNSNESTL